MEEEEAKELLRPMIDDGYSLRNQLLQLAREYPSDFSNEDLFAIANMNDETAAVFSCMVYCFNGFYGSNILATKSGVTGEGLLHCAGAALGLNAIRELSVSGFLTAKTLKQVAKIMLKRYLLGYVSLAIAIYEFVECVNDLATPEQIIQQK